MLIAKHHVFYPSGTFLKLAFALEQLADIMVKISAEEMKTPFFYPQVPNKRTQPSAYFFSKVFPTPPLPPKHTHTPPLAFIRTPKLIKFSTL